LAKKSTIANITLATVSSSTSHTLLKYQKISNDIYTLHTQTKRQQFLSN